MFFPTWAKTSLRFSRTRIITVTGLLPTSYPTCGPWARNVFSGRVSRPPPLFPSRLAALFVLSVHLCTASRCAFGLFRSLRVVLYVYSVSAHNILQRYKIGALEGAQRDGTQSAQRKGTTQSRMDIDWTKPIVFQARHPCDPGTSCFRNVADELETCTDMCMSLCTFFSV